MQSKSFILITAIISISLAELQRQNIQGEGNEIRGDKEMNKEGYEERREHFPACLQNATEATKAGVEDLWRNHTLSRNAILNAVNLLVGNDSAAVQTAYATFQTEEVNEETTIQTRITFVNIKSKF
uniref:Uncharacterized protein n=1 Tax=Rhabditophanes sp. KR3021 TaxID=114890 RepID=A0AC35TLB4_9BILA